MHKNAWSLCMFKTEKINQLAETVVHKSIASQLINYFVSLGP